MSKNINKNRKSRIKSEHLAASGTPRLVDRRGALSAFGGTIIVAAGLYVVSGLMGPKPAVAEKVVVFKDPTCECCGRWINHMRREGFEVAVRNVEDVGPVKTRLGVPDGMTSCHTATVGGYVFEGHIPAMDIRDILAEQPDIIGLAVPGMPMSAPGMDSLDDEPFTVYSIAATGIATPYAAY